MSPFFFFCWLIPLHFLRSIWTCRRFSCVTCGLAKTTAMGTYVRFIPRGRPPPLLGGARFQLVVCYQAVLPVSETQWWIFFFLFWRSFPTVYPHTCSPSFLFLPLLCLLASSLWVTSLQMRFVMWNKKTELHFLFCSSARLGTVHRYLKCLFPIPSDINS